MGPVDGGGVEEIFSVFTQEAATHQEPGGRRYRTEGDALFGEGMRIDGAVNGDIRTHAGQPGILVVSETARMEGAFMPSTSSSMAA